MRSLQVRNTHLVKKNQTLTNDIETIHKDLDSFADTFETKLENTIVEKEQELVLKEKEFLDTTKKYEELETRHEKILKKQEISVKLLNGLKTALEHQKEEIDKLRKAASKELELKKEVFQEFDSQLKASVLTEQDNQFSMLGKLIPENRTEEVSSDRLVSSNTEAFQKVEKEQKTENKLLESVLHKLGNKKRPKTGQKKAKKVMTRKPTLPEKIGEKEFIKTAGLSNQRKLFTQQSLQLDFPEII